MKPPKENTFVIPCIRDDLIDRCLETLYANTPDNFYVIVVDQSVKGINPQLRDKYMNLMIIRSPRTDVHHTGNLGFTQATNLGIQLTQTPYMTFLNDDVEFIHPDWWQGTMDTFVKVQRESPTRPAMIVNVASAKLPDWSVGRPAGDDFYILPYKEKYTDKEYRFLVDEDHYINEHLTIKPNTVIDGINLYCSVTDTRKLLEVGMLDELFYPGGADDYDLCCRASMFGYRCVGTTLAWVFHHWSKSFADVRDKAEMQELVQDELKHGNLEEKWGYKRDKQGEVVTNEDGGKVSRFDLWGIRCPVCDEILHTTDGITASCPKHPEEVYPIPENTVTPL